MVLNQESGLAVMIDSRGKITQILFNDLLPDLDTGTLLPVILSEGQFSNAMNFLQRVQNEKLVFDVSLAVDINGHPENLCFSGVVHDDMKIVTASVNQGLGPGLYDQIARMNNELTNSIREALKHGHTSYQKRDVDYDEFAKLNNELVNTQRQLNKKNCELQLLNEEKNTLLGIAAHDLRNPLGIISGYASYLLLDDESLDERQSKVIRKIMQASDAMSDMLEDILSISQIEAGKVNLKKSSTDVVALIKHIAELNQVIARKKSIIVEVQVASGDAFPDILVDPLKLEQVVNNLVSNAIKYSKANTIVSVRLESSEESVKITVTDEGQGIPESDLHNLFKPFGKTSVSATAGEKSTGLGLAISDRIVRAHGGVLAVNSMPGIGSVFSVTLPRD